MPIREYRCAQCKTEFEELVFNDHLPPCPSCGASKVEQLMSCCRFRGSGDDFSMPSASGSGGGCSGCAGGNCGSCH